MSRPIASGDDLERWRLEERRLLDLMQRVDTVVRDTLRTLKCPEDPVALFAILTGEQAAPWPARDDARYRRRAEQAMYARVFLEQLRGFVDVGNWNAARAAHAALQAGLSASAVLAPAVRAAVGTPGGRITGARIALEAAAHDAAITRHYRAWHNSDTLQDLHRSPVAYISAKTHLARRTIERRLAKLVPPQRRKSRQ